MASYSLVFLIINCGAEMIFILHARLCDLNLSEEGVNVVMGNIVRHMFGAEFMAELFRPQPLYSLAATKEVFQWLTETSIIHLSTASMNKLFEIMTMVVKYQLFALRHPLELVELTWTHLEEVERLLEQDTRVRLLPVFKLFEELCERLNAGDLAEIRKELLNHFSGRRTLVSLLLNCKVQSQRGSFFLPEDRFLPPLATCEPPGSVHYYSGGRRVASTTFEHRDAALRHPLFVSLGQWDPKNPATRISKHGMNMYVKNVRGFLTRETIESSQHDAEHMVASNDETRAVMEELNRLSSLVRGEQSTLGRAFRLNLFAADDDAGDDRDDGGKGDVCLRQHEPKNCGVNGGDGSHSAATCGEVPRQNQELLRIMRGLHVDDAPLTRREMGKDLLDIMDED